MFGLKELLLLNAISHKKSQKRKNQTTNKKKRKIKTKPRGGLT